MFSVIQRKPEDVKLEVDFKEKVKQLNEEYQGKRSAFDKTLSKYNTLLKKLNIETNSIKISTITEDIKKLESELNATKCCNNHENDIEVGKVIAPNTDKKLPIKKKKGVSN
jgi:hypothetical protein